MKGSIRQRSPGSWELTIDLRRAALGKRCGKYATVSGTKSAAQRELRHLLSTLDKGIDLPSKKILIPIGCDEAVFSTDRAFWIPAFTGMTDKLVVSQPIHGVFKTNWYYARLVPTLARRGNRPAAAAGHRPAVPLYHQPAHRARRRPRRPRHIPRPRRPRPTVAQSPPPSASSADSR